MECKWYTIPLLIATAVLADYNIDNANTSVVYSAPPSSSGQATWSTFSTSTLEQALSITNSTGNFTIPLDPSHCFDQNYAASSACGTTDNCFVQIPFVGSGITMYVYNAGASGMTASFSVDGGTAASNSIDAPPGPTFQVSNVSLFDIQGLPTGNHTMTMTLLDWNNGPTFMKFDYAHVNETFVAAPAKTSSTSSVTSTLGSPTSSQTPTQTSAGSSASSHSVNIGGAVGASLGGFALLTVLIIAFLYLRRRKPKPAPAPIPGSTFQVNPFQSDFGSPPPASLPYVQHPSFSSQNQGTNSTVPPLMRSALLRDAFAAGSYPLDSSADQSAPSVMSGRSSAPLQPLRRQPSNNVDAEGASHVPDVDSPFGGPDMASRYNLTADQVEVVNRLRADNVPLDAISRVIERYVATNVSSSGEASGKLHRGRSIVSAAPPPSYQTNA